MQVGRQFYCRWSYEPHRGPGGKDTERELVKKETVERNKQAIAAQVKRLFSVKNLCL